MATMRLALAQHDFPVGAVADNAACVTRLRDQAAAEGASLVVFPAATLGGATPGDLLLHEDFVAACERERDVLAERSDATAVVLGLPCRRDGQLHDSVDWLAQGGRLGTAHRQISCAAGDDADGRYFQSGDDVAVVEWQGVRVAVLPGHNVDDDAVVARARHAGAQLLLVPAAEAWDMQQLARREAALVRQARASGCAIAWVNMVGGQDEALFAGAALLVNADGSVAARAPAFTDALLQVAFDADSGCLQDVNWPPAARMSEEAICYAALVRGLRDYVHKNGFREVVLGLSGGIDSALTLALAVDALGSAHVHAVMLPSRYTSDVSLRGARAQTQTLGVEHRVLPIEATFQALLDTLQPAFAGRTADVTEENLQARIRGVLLMALSNKHGWLLLCTGNKSEAAVGYDTLYGDMCGGYAPLRDVYKTLVYRLARWRNARQAGPGEVIPSEVIERAPSAELREGQLDQDSLPAYAELDTILECLIEQRQSPSRLVAEGHDADTVGKVAALVRTNEFKRRQGAPGPRVTRGGFGSERNWPITSAWR